MGLTEDMLGLYCGGALHVLRPITQLRLVHRDT